MKRKRRKAPVSTLRTRLARRMRDHDEWDGLDGFADDNGAEPFFLTAAFRRMHRFLALKIAVALAVLLLAGLLYRGDYDWGEPVIDGLRFATSWDLDLNLVADQAVPAFRAVWNHWELPGEQTGPGVTSPPLLPLEEGSLRSGFGLRLDPVSGREEMHYGIDLAAPEGTPVRAIIDGQVRGISGEAGAVTVLLDHGAGWETLYRGLAGTPVEEGEAVKQGGLLGRLGEAVLWNSPHLHFELRYRGRPVAPPPEWLEPYVEEPKI